MSEPRVAFLPIEIVLPEYQKADGKKASSPFSKSSHGLFTRGSLASAGNGDGARTNYFKQQLVRLAEASASTFVPYRFTDAQGTRRSMDGGCLKFVGPDAQGIAEFVEQDGYIIGLNLLPSLMQAYASGSDASDDVENIFVSPDLPTTQKSRLVQARLGQGRFRDEVLQMWNGACAVTGVRLTCTIRASHIKPWRLSTDSERLSPFNGLPLIATLDALFDAGLISFNDDGALLQSQEVLDEGLELKAGLRHAPHPETLQFLRRHRLDHGFQLDGSIATAT